MRGKKTSQVKKEAIRAVLESNPDMDSSDIARIVQIPDRTVRELIPQIMTDTEFADFRQKQKMSAIEQAWKIANTYLNHLKEDEIIKKAQAKDTAIVIGTLIDKAQLLAGDPTSNIKVDEATDTDLKNKLDALINGNPSIKDKLKQAR